MRLLILSDLHLEHWREQAPAIELQSSRPDLVILAGDIHNDAAAVGWAARSFKDLPVLYVHGNHEAYGSNLQDMQQAIEQACLVHPQVHFLNQREVILNGVRFLGATLWTDYCLFGAEQKSAAFHASEKVVMDYHRIRISPAENYPLTPEHTVYLHQRQRAWLADCLNRPFDGKTVVITHMAPSLRSVASRYADSLVSAAFASSMDDLASRADLWIHGHTHDSFDYQIGDCRVVCNPCGYRLASGLPENPDFNPGLIVELA